VVAAFSAALGRGELPVLHGDGRQSRDFLFVDDAVDALMLATRRGSGLVVNVGTGRLTSVRDLWSALAGPDSRVPSPSPHLDGGLARMAVSPTRARIHLTWESWTTLEQGLQAVRPNASTE
jgi:UDP-glucose 4-epimerase